MSTEESERHARIGFGKDAFTASELTVALGNKSGLTESNSTLVTDADWEKFWAAVNKVNAPTSLLSNPMVFSCPALLIRLKALS